MNIKRKLISGSMAAVMGMALIGGGTWSAFNDVETVSSQVQAGKLNLEVVNLGVSAGQSKLINLANLKPGDTIERTFRLKNSTDATLAIRDVLMSVKFGNFSSGGGTNQGVMEFLEQLQVKVLNVGNEGSNTGYPINILGTIIGSPVTLADMYYATSGTLAAQSQSEQKIKAAMPQQQYWVDSENKINLVSATGDAYEGLPVNPSDYDDVKIIIEFKDDQVREANSPLFVQNKYQGNSAEVIFNLEARQWTGIDVQAADQGAGIKSSDPGYIKANEKARSGR